ncbi:MAG: hypothetical protein AB7P40_21440 [Chloroflexota bacterium]
MPRLQEALDENAQGCLVLSFEDVPFMDASFADEVFAEIAASRSRGEAPPRCLVLSNLDSTSYDNLMMALTSRPVREPGLRNCVLPVRNAEGRVDLVGKWEDQVRATFECLRESERLTARELANSQGLEIGAASTRLKVLFDLGLTCRREARDERGRLYVYMSIG